MCCARRCSRREPPWGVHLTVRVAILAARQGGGWHTDQLCRALAGRGHEGRVLPYEALVAHLGGAGTASGVAAAGEDIGGWAAGVAGLHTAGALGEIVVLVAAV